METNLFESLMFIVRNYQGDDEDPGERPNLFQEIVSDTVNLMIIVYLNIYSYRTKNSAQITVIARAGNLNQASFIETLVSVICNSSAHTWFGVNISYTCM